MAKGVLFLLPVVVIVVVLKKALDILRRVTASWDERLKGEIIWGLDGHNIAGILTMIILCIITGLAFQTAIVKRCIDKAEAKVLSYFPGYLLLKSLASEVLDASNERVLVPVLVKDGDSYRPGFLTEQHGGLCTVFIPEVPQVNAGELQIVLVSSVIRLPISSHAMKHMIRNLGKGITRLTPEHSKQSLFEILNQPACPLSKGS